jgi:tetratricopeptide (TPR) repeat protein
MGERQMAGGMKPLWAARFLLRTFAATGVAVVLAAPLRVGAQSEAQALAMLPPYCKHTVQFGVPLTKAESDHWWAVLGATFAHIHHYCRGLLHTNNALYGALGTKERLRELSLSIPEITYVVDRSPKDFILLPEVLWRRGENYIRLGDPKPGIKDLQRAMEIKPDYWPPYASMSDYLKSIGDLPKAREWLEKALALNPDSKALKLRLAELNSAKAKPVSTPAKKPAPEADTQAAAPKAAAKPEPESTVK